MNAAAPETGSKDWLAWIDDIHEVGHHLSGISHIMRLVYEDRDGPDMALWHLAESVLKATVALDKITERIDAAHRKAAGA